MNRDDIADIHQLMSLYGHYMDMGQSKQYRSIGRHIEFEDVFVDSIAFTYMDTALRGRAQFEKMTPPRVAPTQESETGPIVAHCVTNVFVYQDGDTTRVHAKFFVPLRPAGVIGTGDYHNVVVKTSRGWRISEVDARVRSFPNDEIARPSLAE
jgi:hypothetical protein